MCSLSSDNVISMCHSRYGTLHHTAAAAAAAAAADDDDDDDADVCMCSHM